MGLVATADFFTLVYALRYFAFSDTLLYAWIETVVIALAVGWVVVDTLFIVVRNNLSCTKKILHTRRYQYIEKFFIGPVFLCIQSTERCVQLFLRVFG